jgi:hypothetical protein
VLLSNGDARAIGCRNTGRADAAGAGTDYEQVKVGHYSPALSIKARVDGSKLSSSAESSSLRAISLPSSTPNWSNGLMRRRSALAKVRCS